MFTTTLERGWWKNYSRDFLLLRQGQQAVCTFKLVPNALSQEQETVYTQKCRIDSGMVLYIPNDQMEKSRANKKFRRF